MHSTSVGQKHRLSYIDRSLKHKIQTATVSKGKSRELQHDSWGMGADKEGEDRNS